MQPSRLLAGFLCSALASMAGMFLPFILHGVRNLPWEIIFGFAFYITAFFRSALGERLEGFISGVLWPFVVIALVWFAGARLWAAGRRARLASLWVFVLSLVVCVSSQTANSLATRIPLYLNESHVRF